MTTVRKHELCESVTVDTRVERLRVHSILHAVHKLYLAFCIKNDLRIAPVTTQKGIAGWTFNTARATGFHTLSNSVEYHVFLPPSCTMYSAVKESTEHVHVLSSCTA